VYNNTNWKEISIKIPEEAVNKAIEEVEEAIKTGRNARGLVYAALRGLRDGGFTFPDNNI
jgi:nitrogen regulatory protein PII